MSILSEFLHIYAPQNGWGTFFTAAFGAFAGAFAASRAQNKRAIVAELNALSAAHELSITVANIWLAVKRQHVVPLKEDFTRIKAAYSNHQTMVRNGLSVRESFQFTADLRSLVAPATPHEALEKTIFGKTLTRGRALGALVTLVGAVDGAGIAIRERNDLVKEWRSAHMTNQERLGAFLGLRTAQGIIDERMSSNIAGISHQADDCIFFAQILATDIARYANDLRWKASWFYRLRVPKIGAVDWSKPNQMGLMPKDIDYENWLQGFRSRPTKWQRFRASFRRKGTSK